MLDIIASIAYDYMRSQEPWLEQKSMEYTIMDVILGIRRNKKANKEDFRD